MGLILADVHNALFKDPLNVRHRYASGKILYHLILADFSFDYKSFF